MNKLIAQLTKLGIKITSTAPWNPYVDGEIQLGGKYRSVHLQVGRGYYQIGRTNGSGKKCRIFYVPGKGNLKAELEYIMAKAF